MEIRFKMTLPDTLEGLVKAKPDALCAAIERAVIKTLSREVRATTKIAFEGEDFNGNKTTTKTKEK